jgi:hypothetical protein
MMAVVERGESGTNR